MGTFLIAGLGNIGTEYQNTRHNIGFMVMDILAQDQFKKSNFAYISKLVINIHSYYLIKPTTYMNLSGNAVSYYLHYYKIPISKLLVVTDDIALEFGRIRLRGKGSAGGHNGLKSIENSIKSNEYARLRIGVGNEFKSGEQVKYVLSNFNKNEMKLLDPILYHCKEACIDFGNNGLDHAMNNYNTQVI